MNKKQVPPITNDKNDKSNESIVNLEEKNHDTDKTELGGEHMDSCCKKCRNCKRKLSGIIPTKDPHF